MSSLSFTVTVLDGRYPSHRTNEDVASEIDNLASNAGSLFETSQGIEHRQTFTSSSFLSKLSVSLEVAGAGSGLNHLIVHSRSPSCTFRGTAK